jgi:CheY-like chemotaxis protein
MSMPANSIKLILVVDDDEKVRAFLAETLKRSGYGVWNAGSEALALKILSERRIDLVIGDSAGLKQDRGKILRKLRQVQPGIKILAMTGTFPAFSATPRFVRRPARFPLIDPAVLKARLFGADATLPKPVSADLLIKTTKRLLGETSETEVQTTS